jgi:hypothetical protein
MSASLPYYPYRALKVRPYFDEFMALPKEERRWDSLVQLALFRTLDSFGREHKGEPLPTACGMNESWLCDGIASFFDGGQVVFHIEPTLKDAFRLSELGDATAADLQFPFPMLYVHLGTDLGLKFNDGAALLEGVLLHRRREGEVLVTLVGALTETPAHWGLRGLESFTFHFSKEDLHRPLLEAARDHIERESRDPNDIPELADLSQFDEKEQTEIRETWKSHDEERRLHAANIGVVMESLKLAANALLYVSQYPEDLVDDYQDGFPAGFREKIERSDGKTRERTLSKARSAGYTLIKRVGKVFERAESAETGESPSPHLRRAHWRRQAHGPRGSLRKLIWIRAVRVLGGTHRDRPYLIVDGAVSTAD